MDSMLFVTYLPEFMWREVRSSLLFSLNVPTSIHCLGEAKIVANG